MSKSTSQVINTILIITGGGMLIYTIAVEEPHKYLQIIGLIIIMLGLYRATNHWVDTRDDHKEEKNDAEKEL